MKHKLLVYVFTLTFVLIQSDTLAQSIHEAKWWAGVKSGINFTKASTIKSYSVFEALVANEKSTSEKQYASFTKNRGFLLGMSIDYLVIPSLAISFQPVYQNYHYHYTSAFSWHDSLSNSVKLTNHQEQILDYFEFPLMAKYGYSAGKIRFTLQAGGFYGRIIGAKKKMKSSEHYLQQEQISGLETYEETFDIRDMILPSRLGIMGGAGISIDINYFRIALEGNYKHSFHNITNVHSRYSNRRLLSAGYDVADDISLQNLEFYIHCSTPLDFLIHLPEFSGKPSKRR